MAPIYRSDIYVIITVYCNDPELCTAGTREDYCYQDQLSTTVMQTSLSLLYRLKTRIAPVRPGGGNKAGVEGKRHRTYGTYGVVGARFPVKKEEWWSVTMYLLCVL